MASKRIAVPSAAEAVKELQRELREMYTDLHTEMAALTRERERTMAVRVLLEESRKGLFDEFSIVLNAALVEVWDGRLEKQVEQRIDSVNEAMVLMEEHIRQRFVGILGEYLSVLLVVLTDPTARDEDTIKALAEKVEAGQSVAWLDGALRKTLAARNRKTGAKR